MARFRISVDQRKCVASTQCTHFAPGTFRMDDETGKATVINPNGDTEDNIREAAEGCPVSAITVEDADTGEHLFP